MNCTECIAAPLEGQKVCQRGIKVTLPEKTVCRKWLRHTKRTFSDGSERHYLENAAGKRFDITDDLKPKKDGVDKREGEASGD